MDEQKQNLKIEYTENFCQIKELIIGTKEIIILSPMLVSIMTTSTYLISSTRLNLLPF